ncbi:9861_t:CDS:2 [Racocetra fulgida]|uniref:9861_t:CDS:1 n=1 Tax=Racocetra fulgida TaxID=60492 RepID=A0A9N8ZIZ9_9GLOM|nr:9861_t:CDS:2 [Racocetra fulgida]
MSYSINPFKLVQISLSFISAAEAAAAGDNVSETPLAPSEKNEYLFESSTEKGENGSLVHNSDKLLKLLIVLERLNARQNIVDEPQHDVLNIYLRYKNMTSAEDIVELDPSTINPSTISFLLNKRINQSIKRLDTLAARVSDPCLKILVIGDVKSRKKSLINALMHHGILPMELQMERILFCEVLNVKDNSGEEEVHAIEDIEKYNRKDPATYSIIPLADLYNTISNSTKEIACIKRDVELLHFLPTKKKLSFNVANDLHQLRESLGNLVTKKILKTIFVPAQDYLRSLVIDIGIVAEFNLYMASCESEKFERQLEEDKADYEQLCKDLDKISSKARKYAKTTANFIYKNTKDRTINAIVNMEQKSNISKLDFRGVLSTLSFANSVRDAMIKEISEEISMCEIKAKRQVDICISKINSLAERLEGEYNEINLEETYSGPTLSAYIIQFYFLEFFYFKQSRDPSTNDDRRITLAATSKILTFANLLGVTNFLGLPKTQRWVSPLKIRDQLSQTNFVDNEAERIMMQSDVKIDLSIEYLEKRIKQTILAAQQRRLGTLTAYKDSIESSEFFKKTFRRAEIIFESLNSLCNMTEDLDF